MKKPALTAVVFLTCVVAFAQGRISFQTDSLHLVYYSPSPFLGGALAGQGVSSNTMPPGVTLVADLYMGTASGSLSLYTTATFGSTPGKWNTVNVRTDTIGPAIPGGTTVFIVTQIRDQAFTAPSTWTPQWMPFGTWYAASPEFTFVLGTSSLAYPAMYATGASLGGGFCTWANGTYPLDSVSAGFRGAIMIGWVPEPSTFALAGLGAAEVLIFRRRTKKLETKERGLRL